MTMSTFATKRARKDAKWAFSTRGVQQKDAHGLSTDFAAAKSGGLVLGRVISTGSHKSIQLTT